MTWSAPTISAIGRTRASPEAELDEACRAAGRDPKSLTRSAMVGVLMGRDAAEVERVAPTQVAEALAQIPQFRVSGQSSTAATYANLRAIGASGCGEGGCADHLPHFPAC